MLNIFQTSSNNSTALRMQNRGVVSIFGAEYPGCNLAAWVPNAPKMEGESKGGDTLLAHDFRRKSSVLYLLSRLARERGGAVWRSHFPAPGNQAAGWIVAIIPPPDFGRDKRYIKPPSLVHRPAAAALAVPGMHLLGYALGSVQVSPVLSPLGSVSKADSNPPRRASAPSAFSPAPLAVCTMASTICSGVMAVRGTS